jgi:hypothetical protein
VETLYASNSSLGIVYVSCWIYNEPIQWGKAVSVLNEIIWKMETASVVWWSEFLATDPEVCVQFLVLPDFSLVNTIEELPERKK